jgi:hypothetical protein
MGGKAMRDKARAHYQDAIPLVDKRRKATYINDAEGRNLAGQVRDGSRTWEYLARMVEREGD